jgi:uncharacterized membrane protein (DUF4010 family)
MPNEPPLLTENWPYLWAIQRLALALVIGVLVGLERQRRGKEAGARTFAFAGLIGCLGGLLGENFALLSLALVGLLVFFLNIHTLGADFGAELTTSASLLVVAFTGVLCARGHTLTPVALGVVTAALLAWKEPFKVFSLGLTEDELRSAILLALLAFVIYPGLPEGTIDSWGLINPRSAWVTVLLIAGIGFANYILLKMFGKGAVELTGFFGGLVNSTVTVTALAERVREVHGLIGAAYRGILLATAAMIVRNAVLLAIMAPKALVSAAPALTLMLLASLVLAFVRSKDANGEQIEVSSLPLRSPFSLRSALKFGLIFLALQVAGTLAQRALGEYGFYAVSLVGGFISSASAVASAGTLAEAGTIADDVAGIGAVIASLTSTLVNLPLVARIAKERPLTWRIAWSLGIVLLVGLIGAIAGGMIVAQVFRRELSS